MINPNWPKTKQAAFNKIWKHFIVRKSPPGTSSKNDEGCVYYDPDTGARCAVGILMSKADAKKMPEGSIGHLADVGAVIVPEELFGFLSLVQMKHDSVVDREFTSRFEQCLRDVAQVYSLKVPS